MAVFGHTGAHHAVEFIKGVFTNAGGWIRGNVGSVNVAKQWYSHFQAAGKRSAFGY